MTTLRTIILISAIITNIVIWIFMIRYYLRHYHVSFGACVVVLGSPYEYNIDDDPRIMTQEDMHPIYCRVVKRFRHWPAKNIELVIDNGIDLPNVEIIPIYLLNTAYQPQALISALAVVEYRDKMYNAHIDNYIWIFRR